MYAIAICPTAVYPSRTFTPCRTFFAALQEPQLRFLTVPAKVRRTTRHAWHTGPAQPITAALPAPNAL